VRALAGFNEALAARMEEAELLRQRLSNDCAAQQKLLRQARPNNSFSVVPIAMVSISAL
jgi:hypothetical protein